MSSPREEMALLPEELGMYVDSVRERYPGIAEVWVLRRPTDDEADKAGCWGLLAFADRTVLDALRDDDAVHRDDVELLIVTDGDQFASAWGAEATGTLASLGWRLEDPRSAVYEDRSAHTRHAVATRVR